MASSAKVKSWRSNNILSWCGEIAHHGISVNGVNNEMARSGIESGIAPLP